MTRQPCHHCGTFVRHTDRIACCASCGQLFAGQAAFDAHYRTDGERATCLDPGSILTKKGEPKLEHFVVGHGDDMAFAWRIVGVNPWAKQRREAMA